MVTETKKAMTTEQVVARFDELARAEKWFDIQNELFADNVKSIDPQHSPYMGFAEGKAAVHQKGMDFVSKIQQGHGFSTTPAVIGGNHFAVGRTMDVTHAEFGRIQINEIMLYEVRDGKIVSEQFFY